MLIGQFYPVDSFVHSLDPRTKLIAISAILVLIFMSDIMGMFIWAAVLALTVKLSNLPYRVIFTTLRSVIFLIALTMIFQYFYSDLHNTLKVGTRLMLMILFASLIPATTSPIILADALGKYLPQEIAMMIIMAMRFIPLLAEEAEHIVKAQKSRGARFSEGSLLVRIKAYFAVLIPLFVIVFKRADELAIAMQSREYCVNGSRTQRCPLIWKKNDSRVTILIVCAFFGVLFGGSL